MEAPVKKTTILIVEDDKALQQALSERFTDEGFHVYSAENGAIGLALARAHHPDIILLDLMMTVVDGLTMLERLRRTSDWGKRVPVIILTNVEPDKEEVMAQVVRDHPSFYMVKSNFMLTEVVAKVRQTLAAASAKAEEKKT